MQACNPFNILLVDDEPPILDMLAHVAKTSFPESVIVNVRSPQETFEFLDSVSAKTLHLILLDIDLKLNQTGLDLLPQLRTLLEGRVPIVMLTSQIEEPNVTQAYRKGAVSYILKPDSLSGWRDFAITLRKYWYELTQLPS